MRIVTYDSARVSLLVPLEELTPLEGLETRAVLAAIQERYSFVNVPNLAVPREEQQAAGLRFEQGLFQSHGKLVDIFQFDVFTDGLVVSASTTDVANAFLMDVVEWLANTYQFRPIPKEARRLYLSQLVFDLNRPLEDVLALKPLLKEPYQTSAKRHFGAKAMPRLARVDYEFDDVNSSIRVPRLTIERRAGSSVAAERFFSSAPLKTSEHLALLSRIEGIED